MLVLNPLPFALMQMTLIYRVLHLPAEPIREPRLAMVFSMYRLPEPAIMPLHMNTPILKPVAAIHVHLQLL